MNILTIEASLPMGVETDGLAGLLGTSELPEGWAVCEMRDVSRVVGGGTPKADDPTNFADDGYPWITPADMSDHRGIYIGGGRRSLSKKGLTTSSATMLPAGAVLFSSRAPIGYVAVASRPVSTNQGFRSFVLGPGMLPEYVYFYLGFAKPLAEQLASGTTFLEISGTNAGRIPMPVPPLGEQKRIAEKVEALLAQVNASRGRLARVPAILKRFRQAVLAAACSGRLTADWRDAHPDVDPAEALLKIKAEVKESRARRVGRLWGGGVVPEITEEERNSLPESWTGPRSLTWVKTPSLRSKWVLCQCSRRILARSAFPF